MAETPGQSTGGPGEETYDKVLVDITRYIFHHQIESPLAWKRARLALLDALGCAIETASISSECTQMLGPVVAGTTVPNGFKLPGTSHQLDPIKGAFDLGTLIRYLDHNDAFPGAEWGHPSDNIGALLSVADWLSRTTTSAATPVDIGGDKTPSRTPPPMTMRTLLSAQIKAYEIQGCLQELNSFNAVGLDHTILVKIASTASVSWLLGLSENQTLAALSQAFQDGHPLRTYRQAPNAGPRKGWAAGDACMRAVQMALLTRDGQPGAPTVLTALRWGFYETLFRGREFLLKRVYSSWVMETVFFKLIPAEGHTISAVEAALQLVDVMRLKNISAELDVERVRIRTQKPAYTIVNKSGPLRNAADRDHCLQFIIAVVLLKDPRVNVLRAKMDVVEEEQFTLDYQDPRKRSCSSGLTVTLNDGTAMDEVLVEFPIGHPGRGDTLKQLRLKVGRNLSLAFGEERVQRMEAAVERDDLKVCEFVDLFWKGAG